MAEARAPVNLCADGGTVGGHSVENVMVGGGQYGNLLAAAIPGNGRGTAEEHAASIAAELAHVVATGAAASARLVEAGLISAEAVAAQLPIGIQQVTTATSDSASVALKTSAALAELKRMDAVARLGGRNWLCLQPTRCASAASWQQDVQGPAAADGSTCSPSGRVPPPALISELGEWHLSTLSDDERFLESELMVLNCLFHAAGHAIEAISNAVETYVRERPEGEGGIQQDIAAWRRLRGGPRGTGKSERLAGDYNILNNIVNHLSHTISKCLSDIAQQDWSNKTEDEKLVYMDGLGEAAFTGIGRVTGARAGAVVTQTVYVDNWRAKYLRALELRTQSGEKLSGYQQYHAQALKHPLIIAGVRAKAIASTLVYVPLLDAVQQVERSGCASSLAAEASSEEGVLEVLRGRCKLFEHAVQHKLLLDLKLANIAIRFQLLEQQFRFKWVLFLKSPVRGSGSSGVLVYTAS
ncbi:hypothetical protein T492DRAFT_1141370 [Pavlovales sp. CCMP2436]|nr:hypothetical protein T492DRAFT_1141370 [Pavlovales sp. CCMP2436]